MKSTIPFQNQKVEAVFESYSKGLQQKLLKLRDLIFETATDQKNIGSLDETLKWGQPSYLTSQTGSGTTIRIDQIKNAPDQYALYVHCQTSLMTDFKNYYADVLQFEGNRCIRFNINEDPPEDAVRHCIKLALTYHLNKAH